jgi:hypothetical protein
MSANLSSPDVLPPPPPGWRPAPPPPGYYGQQYARAVGSTLRQGYTTLGRDIGGGVSRAYSAAVRGTWFEKHGKTVGLTVAAAGGVAVTAIVIYAIYQALIGGAPGPNNPTACNAAAQNYSLYEGDIQEILNDNPGGLTSEQQAEVATLSSEAGQQMSYIGTYCSPTCSGIVGCSIADVQTWMANYGAYLGWIIAAPVVGGSAYGTYLLIKRLGRKPSSPGGSQPPQSFNPATVGGTVAKAGIVAEAEKGQISPAQAKQDLANLDETFPTSDVASNWTSAFATQAQAVQEETVLYDALTQYEELALTDAVIASAIALDTEEALALLALLG